jgi:hypothetical protein
MYLADVNETQIDNKQHGANSTNAIDNHPFKTQQMRMANHWHRQQKLGNSFFFLGKMSCIQYTPSVPNCKLVQAFLCTQVMYQDKSRYVAKAIYLEKP